jgi:hypothetical protein
MLLCRHHLLAQQDLALASSLAQQVAAVEELYQRISGQYTNVMISFDQVPAPVVHHKAPAPRKQKQQQPPPAEAPAPIPTPIVTAVPVEEPKYGSLHFYHKPCFDVVCVPGLSPPSSQSMCFWINSV